MHQRTDLASGQVTNHDRILIELVQPRSTPGVHHHRLAYQSFRSERGSLPGGRLKTAALFAQAATRLAQHKAKRL
jgi:hypothetical protein